MLLAITRMAKALKSLTFAPICNLMYYMRMFKDCKAVIFDMDGVLVDNFSCHLQAWERFCANHGIVRDRKGLLAEFGGTNRDIFTRMFKRELTDVEIKALEDEKESLYRMLYLPQMVEVKGLSDLLEQLRQRGYAIGMATSAPTPNVDMVADGLNIRHFFKVITDATHIRRGKPDPEIFLRCAADLGYPPHECVVFEDSVSGILAAKAAGMPVIALLTTHAQYELPEANAYIKDFADARLLRVRG